MRRPLSLPAPLQSHVPFTDRPDRWRRLVPVLVFVAVAAVRTVYWAALEASPLSDWNLWMETDEWGYVDWSAHLASGHWLDVPAWRSYFLWQTPYGPPETWDRWYQKNAYFAGPLYPYALALIRVAGLPLLLSVRLVQLLLASAAAAALAAAAQAVAGRFLLKGREGSADAPGGGPSTAGPAVAGAVCGLLYGAYGPLVFHDGFAYRDGPVAHLSALLLVWPLLTPGPEERRGAHEEMSSKRGMGTGALLLGLVGGLATLLKQTLLPLAFFSVLLLSKKSPAGAKRTFALGVLGLALPLTALAARNVAVGVPPLTFDTRQAIGLAWGNGRGADATTAPPPTMKAILDEAGGSTSKTARLVLAGWADAPLSLPALWAKKAATFFLAYEVPDNANWYFFRDRLSTLRLLPVFPCVVGAGIVGLCAALARGVLRREEGWFVAAVIATPLAACLLVQTTSRYRVGVVPPLAVGCGLLVFLFLEEWRARRRAQVVVLSLAALVVAVLSAYLPSPIPVPRHRWSDTVVAATLTEAREGPAAAVAEIERFRRAGRDDPRYEQGLRALSAWEAGDRSSARIAPPGVAPPEARYRGAPSDGIR